MKLYFGNAVTAVTTVMMLVLLGFIGCSVAGRGHISYWGRRSAFLLVFGLVVCCFAAARDGLDKTVRNAIDGNRIRYGSDQCGDHTVCSTGSLRNGFTDCTPGCADGRCGK